MSGSDQSSYPGDEPETPETGAPEWQEPATVPSQDGQGEGQLPLTDDDDVSLPWLEGDDDGEDYEGYGAGQLLSLVMLGLAVLALVVGAIWWLTRKGDDSGEVVADGSTVAAPAQPYKQRPDDPEGKTFEGTGDTSFAVSEGQTRPARLGEEAQPGTAPAAKSPAAPGAAPGGPAGAKPGFDPAATGAAPAAAAAAPAASGVGVQVGAFSTREAAEAGWSKLAGKHSALSGVSHRVVEGQADIGKVFRLQAVSGDAAAARALCGRLKAAGVNCQVKN